MTLTESLHPLQVAKVGSCDCLVKSPKIEAHSTTCGYRLICEAEKNIKEYLKQVIGDIDD